MIKEILIISILLIQFNLNTEIKNQSYQKAYFASGCFWCVEGIYENLNGVIEVNSGYSGGFTKNPNYDQVISGRTEVVYRFLVEILLFLFFFER